MSAGRDNGLGWALTLIDTLLHEYGGLNFMDALHLHLARAFALYAAIRARYGQAPAGPTYEEAALLERLGPAKARGGDSKPGHGTEPAWQA